MVKLLFSSAAGVGATARVSGAARLSTLFAGMGGDGAGQWRQYQHARVPHNPAAHADHYGERASEGLAQCGGAHHAPVQGCRHAHGRGNVCS